MWHIVDPTYRSQPNFILHISPKISVLPHYGPPFISPYKKKEILKISFSSPLPAGAPFPSPASSRQQRVVPALRPAGGALPLTPG
jgi:hypothetical protein